MDDKARHRGLLYLPRVSAPHLHPRNDKKLPKRNPPKMLVDAVPKNFPESDSDPEQFVSEFDRDQKLV